MLCFMCSYSFLSPCYLNRYFRQHTVCYGRRNHTCQKQLIYQVKACGEKELDKIALPTPFGIVFRQFNQLPENIAILNKVEGESGVDSGHFTEDRFEELVSQIRTRGSGTVVVPNSANTPLNPSDFKRRAEASKSIFSRRPSGSQENHSDNVASSGYQIFRNDSQSSPSTREKLSILQELTFYPTLLKVPFFLECTRLDGPCEKDELLRSQAVYSLAIFIKQGICNKECVNAILYSLNSDPDSSVRASAASALGFIREKNNVQALIHSTLEDGDWLVKMSCINSLGALKDSRAIPVLLALLKKFPANVPSRDSFIIQSLIGALAELESVDAVPYLVQFRESPDEMLRFQLAESLRFFRNNRTAMEALQSLAEDESSRVSHQAVISLNFIQDIS
ncbi:hypothetical protein GpartN1_g1373.t1 [Galdieria partita]|uniref:Uncharacterized protein n=1 Tax=Galdieria partita TaxID=83374 RepID=A0A9C7PTS4_9RHOD|nr:hypothetical protein GpartN1_g1373.t1 [Galdieria partita]